MRHTLPAAVAAVCFGLGAPAVAQTVIYPDPPPARSDSARPAAPMSGVAPRDTTRRDSARAVPPRAAVPAPAPAAPPLPAAVPAPPVDPVVTRLCVNAAPGESAPDVLGIVFERAATPESRDAAIATVSGKRLGGNVDDELQYVQVPAGGSEFRLRALADKLIRRAGVTEVGPVACPAQPAPLPAAPVRRDSASS